MRCQLLFMMKLNQKGILKNALMNVAKNFFLYNPDSHLTGYYRNLVKGGMSVTEARKRVARALVRVIFRILYNLNEDDISDITECDEKGKKRESDMASGSSRRDKNHISNISLSPLKNHDTNCRK